MEMTMETTLLFAASMLIAGVVAGIIAGLLGVGGGIVLVPAMFYLFTLMDVSPDVRMHLAVGTSLSTIIVTAWSSSRAHYKRGAVDVELLKGWGPWLFFGAVVGMFFFSSIKSLTLTFVFSAVTFLLALYMLFSPQYEEGSESTFPGGVLRGIYGIIVASLSSIMGIGGGSLSVPLLTYYHFPIRRAVGTAAAVGLIIALPGTIGAFAAGYGDPNLPPFSIGYVNILAFVILIPVTGYFAPIGSKIAHTINPKYLRYAFAGFLIFNAVNMLITAF